MIIEFFLLLLCCECTKIKRNKHMKKKIHPHDGGWIDYSLKAIYSQLPALLFQPLPASPIRRPAYAPFSSASSVRL